MQVEGVQQTHRDRPVGARQSQQLVGRAQVHGPEDETRGRLGEGEQGGEDLQKSLGPGLRPVPGVQDQLPEPREEAGVPVLVPDLAALAEGDQLVQGSLRQHGSVRVMMSLTMRRRVVL